MSLSESNFNIGTAVRGKKITEKLGYAIEQFMNHIFHEYTAEDQQNDQQNGGYKSEEGYGDHQQEVPNTEGDTKDCVAAFGIAVFDRSRGMFQIVRPIILVESYEASEESFEGGSQGLAVKVVVCDGVTDRQNHIANYEYERDQRGDENQ